MRRRFGADVLLAIVLPVVAVLALLLLDPDRGQPHGKAPVETPLTSASVVCPKALPGTGLDLLGVSILGADPEAKVKGDVQVGLGSSAAPLPVRTRPGLRPPRRGSVRLVVTGSRRPRARSGRGALAVGPAGRGRLRATGGRTVVHRGRRGRHPRLGGSSWSTPTPARPSPKSRSAHPTASSTCQRCSASRWPATPACSSTSARSCRTARSSHSRCTPAGVGSRCTSSTPTTSSVPGATGPGLAAGAGRAGHRQPAARPHQGRRRTHARAGQPGHRRGAGHDHGGDADPPRSRRPASRRSGWHRTRPRQSPWTTCLPRRPRTAPSGCSSSPTARSPRPCGSSRAPTSPCSRPPPRSTWPARWSSRRAPSTCCWPAPMRPAARP